jgi:hypothetical protein
MKVIFLFSALLLFSGISNLLYLEGQISVKGNVPHTYLSLATNDNKEYSIVGKYKKEIWTTYQGQVIKVEGKITKKAIGPGLPAEFEVTKIIIP